MDMLKRKSEEEQKEHSYEDQNNISYLMVWCNTQS